MTWLSELTSADWMLLVGLLINALATVFGMRGMARSINTKVDAVQIAENVRLEKVARQAAEAAALLLAAQAAEAATLLLSKREAVADQSTTTTKE